MSPRSGWPADRAAVRRVRAAIEADRPVASHDRTVAEQLLARMCWSPVGIVVFVLTSVVLVVEPWNLGRSAVWNRSLLAIALRLGSLLLCAWVVFQQSRLRRWRRRHLTTT